MIVNPSKQDREQLVRDVMDAADLDSLDVPVKMRGVFNLVRKKLTFSYGAVPRALGSAGTILLTYGYFERVCEISLLLGRIDRDTWGIDYNYVRGLIHHTAYVAYRCGYESQSKALKPIVRMPPDWVPQERTLLGLGLRLPFEKMEVWQRQPVDMTSTIVGEAFADLRALSTMSLFGGSRDWPQQRIDDHYDDTVRRIKEMPGWGQW